MSIASLIARARAAIRDAFRAPAMLCAGGCNVESPALCDDCRNRYLRLSDLRASSNAAALRWHDDTSRELSRRGAPDINARTLKDSR